MRTRRGIAGLGSERRLTGRGGAVALMVALLCGALGLGLSEGSSAQEAARAGMARTQRAPVASRESRSFIEQSKFGHGSTTGQAGWSVALSADGSTALVGAPFANELAGGVAVFTRSGSSWRQTATLTPKGETGLDEFGFSVSLSADGNTALIGAPHEDGGRGGVWVFTRTGSTWAQSGEVLKGGAEGSAGQFGGSVALSGNGQVAVIGAPHENDGKGAAWVFTRSGSTWIRSGEAFTDAEETTEGQFGYSVAISSNGEAVLVGEPLTDVAWVFTRSGSHGFGGTKLLEPHYNTGEHPWFGWSVALSSNGEVALIGGPHAKLSQGGAWAFTRSGRGWKQEGRKLLGTKTTSHYLGGNEDEVLGDAGDAVALSANGKTALVGGQGFHVNEGAAWVFTWTGSTWKHGGRLKGKHETIEGGFGASVALAGNGKQVLIGGPRDSNGVGGVWAFAKVAGHSRPKHARKRRAPSQHPAGPRRGRSHHAH